MEEFWKSFKDSIRFSLAYLAPLIIVLTLTRMYLPFGTQRINPSTVEVELSMSGSSVVTTVIKERAKGGGEYKINMQSPDRNSLALFDIDEGAFDYEFCVVHKTEYKNSERSGNIQFNLRDIVFIDTNDNKTIVPSLPQFTCFGTGTLMKAYYNNYQNLNDVYSKDVLDVMVDGKVKLTSYSIALHMPVFRNLFIILLVTIYPFVWSLLLLWKKIDVFVRGEEKKSASL